MKERREGIVQNLCYRWSKEFLEAAKRRLAGDTARAATSDEVKELRREASALKEVVAKLTLENWLLKKKARLALGRTAHEIPRGREAGDHSAGRASPLLVRHTLAKLGIARATFYRWYDRYSRGGPEALNDRWSRPDRVWNRILDGVRDNLTSWHSTSRHCRRASWPYASPTRKAISSQTLRSTTYRPQPAVANRLHLSEGDQLGWFYLSTGLDDFSRWRRVRAAAKTEAPSDDLPRHPYSLPDTAGATSRMKQSIDWSN